MAIGGCTYAFDDYLPQRADAGVATNAKPGTTDPLEDANVIEEDSTTPPPVDSGVFETMDTIAPDTVVDDTALDAPADACTCIKYAGGKCKEWSPPGCGS